MFIFLLYHVIITKSSQKLYEDFTKKLEWNDTTMQKKKIPGIIFLLLSCILWIATIWCNQQFPDLDFASVIFYLKVPMEGSNLGEFSNIITRGCILTPVITLLIFLTTCIPTNPKEHKLHLPLDFWKRHFSLFCGLFLVCTVVICMFKTGLTTYIYNNLQATTIYEDYYVDPETAKITFPEEKRNLIYIVMESMETTMADEEFGGLEYANLIPELCELQVQNTNFSTFGHTLNGAIATSGTTWTVAGLVAQTAGIPLTLPLADGNSMQNTSSDFLPGAYSIGEILEEQGYQQEFLLGSDAVFGGRKLYFTQHGNYTINDHPAAISSGRLPADYYEWWGYEDAKLYEYAKESLTNYYESGEPFNLTMLTADTHFIDGYYCRLCDSTYDEAYSNVYSCASRQVADFIDWVQEQPFYENTTIIICGDHPTMNNDYMNQTCVSDISAYQRKTFTVIINPAVDYELDYDRTFTTMDMFPTTLASLGCQIEGDRLALGTNLFSETPTLVEEMKIDGLNSELERVSKYYNRHILYHD